MSENNEQSPDALMLLGTHCPHCPAVLKNLAELVKSGEIGKLEVINLEQRPDIAQQYNVRSVPWIKIGNHELQGLQTLETLRQRIQWATKEASTVAKFDHLLSQAQVDKAIEILKQEPDKISAIMELLGNPGTVLSTRIGIGVIMEEFAGSAMIKELIPQFSQLAKHEDKRIRADVFHYLSLTQSPDAISILEQHANDSDEEIREVIQDSLEDLT
jgi:thioredoxin-like negative regulator of GroEL